MTCLLFMPPAKLKRLSRTVIWKLNGEKTSLKSSTGHPSTACTLYYHFSVLMICANDHPSLKVTGAFYGALFFRTSFVRDKESSLSADPGQEMMTEEKKKVKL